MWARSWDREDPLGEGMVTTPVFWPGESQGWRNLVGYSPWGRTELNMTEATWHTASSLISSVSCNMHITTTTTTISLQSCLTLCNPTDCSLPGFSVHGILQAKTLEWVAISFFRGSSQPRNQTWVSCIADGFFTVWPTREAPNMLKCTFVFLFLHLSCLEFITSPSVNFSCLQRESSMLLKAVIRLGPLR